MIKSRINNANVIENILMVSNDLVIKKKQRSKSSLFFYSVHLLFDIKAPVGQGY